jgi:hypothetical protein
VAFRGGSIAPAVRRKIRGKAIARIGASLIPIGRQ